MAAYAWLFSLWTVRNHDGFGTFGFDLGIYDQGLWLLSRFHAPFITIMGRNLFGDHTSFVLLPLVPVYWVWPSAHVLLIAQSVALAMSAVPIYLIARNRLQDELLACVLASASLLMPTLQWTNFEQFHPDCFEVPLIGFALHFMFERRWRPYFITIALLLSVKEDAALIVLGMGVYVAVRYSRRVGLITCAVAISYALLAVYLVLKIINGVGSLNGWRFPFGGVAGLIRTAVVQPVRLLRYLSSDQRPWYLWQLVAPLGLASLLAPDVVAIAAAPIASNLISNFYYQHRIEYHYSTQIAPVLACAAVVGISRIRSLTFRSLAAGTSLAAALYMAWLWGPTPFAQHPAPIGQPASAGAADIRQAIARIPAEASVSAWYSYVPHLDHRVEIYEFPVPFRAEYWGEFKQEGQRLPQADHVSYLILPASLDPPDQAILDRIKSDFATIYASANVVVMKRR